MKSESFNLKRGLRVQLPYACWNLRRLADGKTFRLWVFNVKSFTLEYIKQPLLSLSLLYNLAASLKAWVLKMQYLTILPLYYSILRNFTRLVAQLAYKQKIHYLLSSFQNEEKIVEKNYEVEWERNSCYKSHCFNSFRAFQIMSSKGVNKRAQFGLCQCIEERPERNPENTTREALALDVAMGTKEVEKETWFLEFLARKYE